jgi:hypothetical protein
MTADQMLHSPVSQLDYQRGKAGALPPSELDPGELYTARLLLSEVARPEARAGLGVYAVDALVEMGHVSAGNHLFAVIRYVSEDGLPEELAYTPRLTEEGIMQGNAAPVSTKEGYLLSAVGDLEDELREIEEENLVPIRVVGTTAIPIERALPYQ